MSAYPEMVSPLREMSSEVQQSGEILFGALQSDLRKTDGVCPT